MSAATQARRRRGPDDLEIVAFERGRAHLLLGLRHPVLDRRRRRATWTQLVARAPEQHRAQRHRRARCAPRSIGDRPRPARGARPATSTRGREYDEPLRPPASYATGACPMRPPVPGHRRRRRVRRADPRRRRGAARARSTRGTVPPGRRGRRRLHRPGDGRGAASARARGHRRRAAPRSRWRTLDPDMGALRRGRACAGSASTLRTRRRRSPRSSRRRRAGRGACTPTPAELPGRPRRARPRRTARTSRWPRDAGIPLGAHRRHRRRPTACARRSPGVWAAGDCVETLHRLSASGRCTSRSAPTPTSRAGSPASTSAAATPPSPA